VKSVSCLGAIHIPERIDEQGRRYQVTADDAAYATFELDGGVVAHINSSWATRVRRDDLLTLHVDGTHGSAVAGLQDVVTQQRMATPKPVWNPDVKQEIDFYAGWQDVPDTQAFDNGFRLQWEAYIRHVVEGAPYKWDLLEGAKGVQLAECALRSWKERRWIDVPELNV
jgi:predicted dehydrogenase